MNLNACSSLRRCWNPAASAAGGCQLRTLHVGPDEIIVAAKVEVPAGATIEQISGWTNSSESAIRSRVDSLSYIFVEPDIRS